MISAAVSWDSISADIAARGRELLVQTLAALVVAAVVVLVGRALLPLVRRYLAHKGRPSRTRVFTALYRIIVGLLAALLALTLAFPSVRVSDVLASLGILSVAVGFAFKAVLENLLSGVLLLLRDPFKSGDQIRLGDMEGTVEGITVRETLLRTFDGQLVLVPNAQVYTSPLEVRTHYRYTRIAFRVRLPVDADVAVAREVVVDVLRDLTPAGAPDPDAVVTSVTDGALELEARVWSGSLRAETTQATDAAITRTLRALADAGIELDEPELVVRPAQGAADQDQRHPGPDPGGPTGPPSRQERPR